MKFIQIMIPVGGWGGGGLGEATMRFNVYIGINSGKSLKTI